MLKIKTKDNIEVIITDKQVRKSRLFCALARLPKAKDPLNLLINNDVLTIVLNFMGNDLVTLSADYNPLEIRFNPLDYEQFTHLDMSSLIDVCNAANYLNYPYLLELCCKIIANKIRNKSKEELKELFDGCDGDETLAEEINNDFDWLSSSEN